MPSDRVSLFLAAKRVLRIHPDWPDEKVAEHVGIPRVLVSEILAPARREIEQDG